MTDRDPSQVLRDARNLVECGQYDEALREYRWFHENAVALNPALCGVRLSFALSYWVQLGDVYPPARAELESIRDAKATSLREGSKDRDLFIDVSAMNEALEQVERTSSLFAEIAKGDREFARKCFPSARAALVHTRDYSLARAFIRSPQETLDRLSGRFNRSIADTHTEATASSIMLQKVEVANYIEDVQHLIEILAGVGEADEAERLRILAIESIVSPAIRHDVGAQLK
ncbi:MAG: hypothetical protein WA532_15710 [Candidatus Korobacteraceae bacterium]